MILVVGATGVLGMEICRRLAPAGKPFRAIVRSTSDPAKKNVLKNLGGELVEADLKDRASLDRASAGATAVISTPTAIGSQQEDDSIETVDLHGQMGLVDAVRAAKVEQCVFVSVSGNLLKHGDNPLFDAKKAVENHLRESGLTFTILRPSCFMEIWLSSHLGFDFWKCQSNDLRVGTKQDQLHFSARCSAICRRGLVEPGSAKCDHRTGRSRGFESDRSSCRVRRIGRPLF